MSVTRDLPYPANNFLVDLGDGNADRSYVSRVELSTARIELVEYRDGNDRSPHPRSIQTVSRYTPLILRRGATGRLDWYEWWNQFRNGDINARRNVTVQLVTEDRATVVMTWRFSNARPTAWSVSPLDALDGGALVESLELSVDRMEVE